MKNTLFAALLIALMASCAKQEPERPVDNPMAIVFGSSIEASTRAGIPDDAEDFSKNDQIGVLGYRKETVAEGADFATPFLKSEATMGEIFTYNADKKFKSTSQAAFFHHGKAHDFYAYYPHDLPINALTAAAPTATLSVTPGTGVGIDVMHAKALAESLFNGRQTTDLAFTHRLSKVKFKITKEVDTPATVLSGIEFAMGKNSGVFDLTTGAVTGTTGKVTLTTTGLNQPVNTGEAQAVAAAWYVLPDDALNDIKVTINGQSITTTASGNITTLQGKIRLITITVTKQGVEMSSSIEPWDTEYDGIDASPNNRIVFGSSIAIPARAIGETDTEFSNGDRITVLGYRAAMVGTPTDFSAPFLYKEVFSYAGGQFTSTSPAAYWLRGQVHNYYAYYPHDLEITTPLTAAAPMATLSVTQANNGIAQDVMHAKVENSVAFAGTTGKDSRLDFRHVLSKVKFRVKKAAAGDPNPVLSNVKFTMEHNGATYNVVTGDVILSALSDVALSKALSQTVSSVDAVDIDGTWMVLPTDVVSGINLTADGKVLEVTIDPANPITTTAGKITIITITIKPSGVEFTDSTLEEWGTDTGSGEVGTPLPLGSKTAAQAAVGDFSLSDGSFEAGAATLSAEQIAACIGIVYWTGNPTTNDDALRRDYPNCKHGLILSLSNMKSTWQLQYRAYGSNVNAWTTIHATDFKQPIINDSYVLQINKIMGYNNTGAILAFNADPANSGWKVEAVEKVLDFRANNPVPASSSPWFLPSVTELMIFGAVDLDALNIQLSKITGAAPIIHVDNYWSSS